jgi:hypothetical protein
MLNGHVSQTCRLNVANIEVSPAQSYGLKSLDLAHGLQHRHFPSSQKSEKFLEILLRRHL